MNQLTRRVSPVKEYTSVYIGICKDIHDPQMLGRIKVLCPVLYGIDLSPWALPCFAPNTFTLPEEGNMVWVRVLDNNPATIMWLGVLYNGKASSFPAPFQIDHPELMDKYTGQSIDRDKAFHNDDYDHKVEHRHPTFYDPHKFGLKFPSGAKLENHDSNDGKFMELGITDNSKAINRSIKLTDITGEEGIILKDAVNQHVKLFDDKKVNANWFIEIKDKKSQTIKFTAKDGEENIKITDKNGDYVKLNGVDGEEYIEIKDEYGNFIKIDATDGAEKLLVQDGYGQKIILNPIAKTLVLQNKNGTGKITIDDGGNITIIGATVKVESNDILLGKDGTAAPVARVGDAVTVDNITHKGIIDAIPNGSATTQAK